ncbi:hypothetical protein, variant [Aphanomyces astaci]|uniref:Uncharacterized protein n=1 Tax=Aphanomyces astaci TaxID=112090 RepID=W4H100_APHAT|nr:hypothetical protein, variant [Aphanomyces astaci]ETV84944.1 hypothetical protein, variant [Aphanomyces astaci]|eukprot:XP_009824962.1 hypothetical protein, variant [Aphanomyces astaci]
MVDTTTKMRGIPPRWSVVGSTVDGRRTLCESLALRYGVVHVTADMLFPTSDGSDGTTIRTIQLSRLHAADCAGRGWVLDGFPQTLEQATALVTEDLVPHMVFDLFVDVASEMAAVLHVLTQHPSTTTTTPIPTVVPITLSSESSDTAASSIHRAIDTSIWTSQLHATVPTLATDHPEAVADIAQGTASLPVTDQAAAMHLLTSLLQPNSTGLADFAADRGHSVAALLGVYTSLTKATQAVLTSRLPPEVVAMLPFVETLSPNALAAMAPLAQELLHEATSSSIQPATAVKLHTAFFDVLSDKERRQLVRMLPPKEQELVTHVVETTEGMSPRGIETVVHMLLQSTSTPLSVAISTKSVSASSLSQSYSTDVGPDSQHPEPTYGTIPASDISPPPSRDAMMTKLALTATKAHGRRLLRWVRRAPRSLRVLLFVSSVLVALTALVSIVLNLVSGQLVLVVASGWVVFFSLLIVSLEVKISAVEKHNAVAAHFPLVGTVPGRGAFLLFVSMLAMTLAVQATWQNAVLGAAGFLSALVSLWAIALGSLASHQFNVMRTRIESAADLRRLFDTADVDNAQELDIDGLARFCVACDWPIGVVLLESVLRDLDIDNSNTVSFSDLHLWWSQAQLDITSSIRPLPPITNIVPSSHDKPMSVLKLVNIFMGVLTVATGVVGNVAAFHDRYGRVLPQFWSCFTPILDSYGLWLLSH